MSIILCTYVYLSTLPVPFFYLSCLHCILRIHPHLLCQWHWDRISPISKDEAESIPRAVYCGWRTNVIMLERRVKPDLISEGSGASLEVAVHSVLNSGATVSS
jgi:hypothetical protein